MTYEASCSGWSRTLAAGLFSLVIAVMAAPVGLMIANAVAVEATGTAVATDTTSDQVAATGAQFRVNESGAATYSIPLYAVPGTAGVTPKISLNYSSGAGAGPLGKGWSIGGLSAVSRCRASREAGDFIVAGVATDGNPSPVNFTSSDRYCLDGQRLIPAPSGSAACPAVSGMTATNLRTEIESFQRVCAYESDANGPKFFTVERQDGSVSWYGDRDNNLASNRPDGYLNSTAPGKSEVAFVWGQTRFQDSTGNYIDYVYTEDVGSPGEQLISKVRYTGKTVLPGQAGSVLSPYAEIVFNYQYMPTSHAYIAGGINALNHRLMSITSSVDSAYSGAFSEVRHYALTYSYGSASPILTSLQECSDSTRQVCAAATTFTWSQGTSMLGGPNGFFETGEASARIYQGSLSKLMGLKFGDIDGDGRQDLVWLKETRSGDPCSTEFVHVLYSRLDASGQIVFPTTDYAMCSPGQLAWSTHSGDGSWFLYDYDGDGRDDWFSAGLNGAWVGFRSTGDALHPFDTSANLLAELAQPIPNGGELELEPQHADLNGDGMIDLVYPRAGAMYARIMERGGMYGFKWGNERILAVTDAAGAPMTAYGFYHKNNYQQLNDFNADARSDLLINAEGTCGSGDGGGGSGGGGGGGGGQQQFKVSKRAAGTSSTTLFAATSTAQGCVVAFLVDQITATTVTVKRFGVGYLAAASSTDAMSFADANGDGLTDVIHHGTSTSTASWRINTGLDWSSLAGSSGNLGIASGGPNTQVADVNGDGRADILTPTVNGYNFRVWYGTSVGGFAGPVTLANVSTECGELYCVPTRSYMFQDIDGDGNVEFMRIKWDDDGSSPVYFSRPSAANRFVPRDVIVKFTNGLGAETNVNYAPLTNNALYRPGTDTRNTAVWGRGTAVQDLLAPMYVVASVSSSSPQASDPAAQATVRYRYQGARMQAGGRGFLGFGAIDTIDTNQSGGFVHTTTTYHQNFPYVGLPSRTIKRAATGQAYSVPACLSAAVTDSCFSAPGLGLPTLAGNWFSDSSHVWEADADFAGTAVTAYSPGVQAPVHVRTAGTDEKLRDPVSGAQTSRVVTTFDYGAYGNVSVTTADTYTGAASSPMATQVTSSVYASDSAAAWRLGRLTATQVTHRRPGLADVVRVADFGYSMSGPITGLLTVERVQPSGNANQHLRKEYTLDVFGNRTLVETCAAPATACDSAIEFHPTTAATVERYSRVAYDSRGRFPLATYEPFWSGTAAVERKTQEVVARDVFGNAAEVLDVNGVRAIAVTGSLGRPYYSWTQTVAGAAAGDPAGGREAWTTYRWCGTAGGQVNCPTGAKFRQASQADGAAASWTYLDALGRPVMTASQTFNAGVSGKDISAVCTDYNLTGKPRRVSNPFFLAGTSGVDGPTGLDDVCTSASRLWTTTVYDVLGRVTDVTSPDATEPGGLAVVSTDYSDRITVVTDARGKRTTQVRNGKGELTSVMDHVGLVTSYAYHADGTLYYVDRDAGRGQVRNTFMYDLLGRKAQQDDPDSGITNYEYNALGELVAQQDANGNRIENEIDARGRVWRKTVRKSDGTIESQSTYTFDTAPSGVGQLASETISGTYSDWVGQGNTALGFSRSYSYDALGRGLGSVTTIDGAAYSASVQYDWLGRAWKALDASGRWAKTVFNARGMATSVCNSSVNDVTTSCPADANTYLQTLETDPWGHVVRERRGNSTAMEVTRSYKPDTGRVWTICAGNTSCNLMSEGYGWDPSGNLHTQQKENRYLEQFTYDDLNRLTEARLKMQDGVTIDQVTQQFEFDALGNLCRRYALGWATRDYTYVGRSGCGLGGTLNSTYGSGGTGTVGPHQVSGLVAGSDVMAHYYDIHGNQTVRQGTAAGYDRTLRYSLDDRAYEGSTDTGARVRFWYGSDGARYKREDGIGAKKTLYLGNVEIVTEGGVTTFKRTVAGVMLQTSTSATGAATNHYLFHDQLGSLMRITDAAGASINQMDYLAFGGRRNLDTQAANGSAPTLTTRGFTGHEMVDAIGITHMNGRVYDHYMGRFLQVDPFIQAPNNAQSWNAYTYVFNNPLRYTDPTGMLGVEERQWLAAAVAIVAACFGQYYISEAAYGAAFAVAVTGGFVSGAIATQSWRGGLLGAMTGAVTAGMGANVAGADLFQRVGLMAFTGGVMGTLQGGDFGSSFLSAGLTSAFMPHLAGIGNHVGRTVVGALVGGTISELTGGKFANGAVSGAVQAAMAGRDRVYGAATDGGSQLCPTEGGPPGADAAELEFMKSIAPEFDAETISSGWEQAGAVYANADKAFEYTGPGSLESPFGSMPTLTNFKGYSLLTTLHSHPIAGTYTVKEADLYVFESNGDFTRKIGDRLTVRPNIFSRADIQGFRADSQNGWALPAGTGKLLYFPVQNNPTDCHYEYGWK